MSRHYVLLTFMLISLGFAKASLAQDYSSSNSDSHKYHQQDDFLYEEKLEDQKTEELQPYHQETRQPEFTEEERLYLLEQQETYIENNQHLENTIKEDSTENEHELYNDL